MTGSADLRHDAPCLIEQVHVDLIRSVKLAQCKVGTV
jgi:hypothetical protein